MPAIHPYQWELLSSMLTFKLSRGLTVEFERLKGDDFDVLYDATHISSIGSLSRWGKDRKPVDASLHLIITYLSDVFPYKTLEELITTEYNPEMFHKCPDWVQFLKYSDNKNSNLYKSIQEIKVWAYERTLQLSKRPWQAVGFSGLLNQESLIKEFEGEYIFFMPGTPPSFDPIYYNPLLIAEGGFAKMQNRYIKKWYYGNAVIKDKKYLQIILFSEKDNRKEGFEYVINVQLNNYGVTAIHFPGITTGFTGNNDIVAYPVLITKDLTLSIESPFVKAFFETCYSSYSKKSKDGKMECLDPAILLELHYKYNVR